MGQKGGYGFRQWTVMAVVIAVEDRPNPTGVYLAQLYVAMPSDDLAAHRHAQRSVFNVQYLLTHLTSTLLYQYLNAITAAASRPTAHAHFHGWNSCD